MPRSRIEAELDNLVRAMRLPPLEDHQRQAMALALLEYRAGNPVQLTIKTKRGTWVIRHG